MTFEKDDSVLVLFTNGNVRTGTFQAYIPYISYTSAKILLDDAQTLYVDSRQVFRLTEESKKKVEEALFIQQQAAALMCKARACIDSIRRGE